MQAPDAFLKTIRGGKQAYHRIGFFGEVVEETRLHQSVLFLK